LGGGRVGSAAQDILKEWGRTDMIQLTRLNNHILVVNCDLIKFIENTPDTVLTLVSGEKVVVLEAPDVVIGKIVEFRRKVLAGEPCVIAASGPEFEQNAAPPSAEHYEG
jgi:flagellar protein FlbD